MDDKELTSLYSGFGWNVKIVEGNNIEKNDKGTRRML